MNWHVRDKQQPCSSKSLSPNILPPLPPPTPTHRITSVAKRTSRDSPRETGSSSGRMSHPVNTPGDDCRSVHSDDSHSSSSTLVPNNFQTPATSVNGGAILNHGSPVLGLRQGPPTMGSSNGQSNLPSFRKSFPIASQRFMQSPSSCYPNGLTDQGEGIPYNAPYFQTTYPEDNLSHIFPRQQSPANETVMDHDHVYQNFYTNTIDANKKCVANEVYAFLKACIQELDIAFTTGPAARKLSSCVLLLQEMSEIVAEGEEKFNNDLLLNGHKDHSHKYCTSGTAKESNPPTVTRTEKQTKEVVQLSPPLSPVPPTDGGSQEPGTEETDTPQGATALHRLMHSKL